MISAAVYIPVSSASFYYHASVTEEDTLFVFVVNKYTQVPTCFHGNPP